MAEFDDDDTDVEATAIASYRADSERLGHLVDLIRCGAWFPGLDALSERKLLTDYAAVLEEALDAARRIALRS